MKKVVFIPILFSLIFINFSILDVRAESQIDLEGKTYLQLDEKGEKLIKNDHVNASLQVSNLSINNNVHLSGTIKTESSDLVPLDLNGALTKAEYPGKLIGELEDKSNNFEVIYFGIEKKSDDNISLLEDTKNSQPALKIYLLEKRTRNFTIFEINNLETLGIDLENIFSISDSLNSTEHINEFWYGKLIKPTSFTTKNEPTPMAITSGKSDVTHTVSYNIGGYIIYEDITVRTLIEGPTALDNSGGTFTTKIYILSQKTRSTSYPSANSSNTNFRIGSQGPTKIEAYTDPGDVFRYIQWDGYYTNGGSIKVDISASFQLPLTPISFSTAYNSSQTVNNHSMKTYDNSGSTKVRKASAEFAKGKKLEKTGQSFDVIFAVGHYNTPAQKKLNVRWSYNLFNSQDLYAFGPQTKSMYFSYASK